MPNETLPQTSLIVRIKAAIERKRAADAEFSKIEQEFDCFDCDEPSNWAQIGCSKEAEAYNELKDRFEFIDGIPMSEWTEAMEEEYDGLQDRMEAIRASVERVFDNISEEISEAV